MLLTRQLYTLTTVCILWLASYAQASEVVFVNPSKQGVPFWDQVTSAAQYAADDLNITLRIVYGNDNRIAQLDTIRTLLTSAKRPDYLLFMPYSGNAKQVFELLEEAKQPFFTLERSIPHTELLELGAPRQIYRYWLGEIFHDNIDASERLTKVLLDKALTIEKPNNWQPLNVVGITGDYSGESYERSKGLVNATENDKRVSLRQIVHANWQGDIAVEKLLGLQKRYGDIAIIWTASDTMALAVAKKLEQQHKIINKQVVVGGFDWVPEAISAIEQEKLTASVGGHYLMAAWGLIRIFDYHAAAIDVDTIETVYQMSVIHKGNLAYYYPLLTPDFMAKVDFKMLTLTLNQHLTQYQFSAESLLDSVSK